MRNKVARQALLYAVDRKQSGAVGEGKSGIATKYVAGFSEILVRDWLDYLNSPYTDSFVIMMLLTGQIHPV